MSDSLKLSVLCLLLPLLNALITTAGGFELHFDEAQYWAWSQQPDWSYYSKGPLVAWLIALSTGLFGQGEWQVRLFAWLAFSAFVLIMYYFTLTVWQRRDAAWWAVALVLVMPLYFPLGLVMTTDIFLFVGWSLALWMAYRALILGQQRAWYGFGAAIGVGALGKLSIGLLPFFLGFFLLFTSSGRRALCSPHFWGGLLLLFVCMSPVIGWNALNDWVMLHHELGHVHGKGNEYGWADFGTFLTGQWLLLSPVIGVLWLLHLARPPRDSGQRLLWGISLLVLVFLLFKALNSKVQPNWTAPAYIGLLVLFAGHAAQFGRSRRRVLIGGMALSVLLLVVALFPLHMGLNGKQDPLKRLKNWSLPVQQVAAQVPAAEFVLTSSYYLAGELGFYWPARIPVYLTSDGQRRHNQYDLWPGVAEQQGRDGAYITDTPVLPVQVQQAFRHCQRLENVEAHAKDGMVLRRFFSWFCREYQPVDWPTPQGY